MFWLFISRFLQFGGLGGVSFDCLVWVDLDLLGWFFWLVFWFGLLVCVGFWLGCFGVGWCVALLAGAAAFLYVLVGLFWWFAGG